MKKPAPLLARLVMPLVGLVLLMLWVLGITWLQRMSLNAALAVATLSAFASFPIGSALGNLDARLIEWARRA